jgi:hypothetical protein
MIYLGRTLILHRTSITQFRVEACFMFVLVLLNLAGDGCLDQFTCATATFSGSRAPYDD